MSNLNYELCRTLIAFHIGWLASERVRGAIQSGIAHALKLNINIRLRRKIYVCRFLHLLSFASDIDASEIALLSVPLC